VVGDMPMSTRLWIIHDPFMILVPVEALIECLSRLVESEGRADGGWSHLLPPVFALEPRAERMASDGEIKHGSLKHVRQPNEEYDVSVPSVSGSGLLV